MNETKTEFEGMTKEQYFREYFGKSTYTFEIPTSKKITVSEKNYIDRLNKEPLICGKCLGNKVKAFDKNDRNPDLITLSDFQFWHGYWCDDCNSEIDRVFVEFDNQEDSPDSP